MQQINPILLVEDNAIARHVNKQYLTHKGYQVSVATNAKEALRALNRTPFALIVMDVGLPDGDGLEISRKIRTNLDCPNRYTPIVVVTAHFANEIDKNLCQEIGLNAVFEKPLTLDKANTVLQYIDAIDHLPLFDLQQAIAFHGSESTAKAVLQTFIDDLEQAQQQFYRLYQTKDWTGLRKTIHKLHGAGLYCGTIRLNQCLKMAQRLLLSAPIDIFMMEKQYDTLRRIISKTIKLNVGYHNDSASIRSM